MKGFQPLAFTRNFQKLYKTLLKLFVLVICSAVCDLIGSDTHNKARHASQQEKYIGSNCEACNFENSIIRDFFGNIRPERLKVRTEEDRHIEEKDTKERSFTTETSTGRW